MIRPVAFILSSALVVACSGTPAAAQATAQGTPPPLVTPVVTERPPTATATTAAAGTQSPTAGQASRAPGTAGDKLQLGDYQYVTMVDAEWSPTGYDEFIKPAAGNVVYAFLMEFEGIDPSGSSYNPLYFKLDLEGTEYNYSPFGKEPLLESGDLETGQTAEGWISFEAPQAEEVIVRYDPVLGLAGQPAEWIVTINE